MKDRIIRTFRRVRDRHSFIEIDGTKLYVVDRAQSENGDVEILSEEDANLKAVCLENSRSIVVFFDGFKKNALPITTNQYSRQCECAILPLHADTDEWLLFIETKYAADKKHAQKKEADYPQKMVQQIKSTVQYFRNRHIISTDKIVHAIISFPNLMEEFDSWTFPLVNSDGTEESVLDILRNDRIIIRATNHAIILNDTELLLV